MICLITSNCSIIFHLICKNPDSEDPQSLFPICFETDQPMVFRFQQQHTVYCGIEIKSRPLFNWLDEVVGGTKSIQCVVTQNTTEGNEDISEDIPLSIPLWGHKDKDGNHFHINNRVDFVFLVQDGKIIGAGVMTGKYICLTPTFLCKNY